MSTTIKIKYNTTASDTPTTLSTGELAVNTVDKKLWVGDATGAPTLLTGGVTDIAHGGTNGTATPTAGGVSYGTGSAYAFSSAGSSGQYLVSNGSSAPSWTSAPGFDGFSNGTVLTSSGTFVTPSTGKFKVTIVGGGGSGRLGSTGGGAGGGGGGATVVKWYQGVTAGTTCTVTIGAGGSSESNGGASSFSGSGITTLTAGGGIKGDTTNGGAGGTGTGGDFIIPGGYGNPAIYIGGAGSAYGMAGGISTMGAGSAAGFQSGTAANGTGYGSGGAGKGAGGDDVVGSGSNGICVIEY